MATAPGHQTIYLSRTFSKGALVPKFTAKALDQTKISNDPDYQITQSKRHFALAQIIPVSTSEE